MSNDDTVSGGKTVQKTQKKKISNPHPYIVMFLLLIIAAIASIFVSSGEYTRVVNDAGITVIDPNSFTFVEHPPFDAVKLITAFPRGFSEASSVIILCFMFGGAFGIIKAAGLIQVGVGALANKFKTRGVIIIPIVFTVFALLGSFIGGVELCLIYIPILMPLFFALGFDSMTTVGMALFSTIAGFTAALTNPFTIGIPHEIGGLPMYSGLGYRAITMLVIIPTGCFFLARYAGKVKKNPELSLMYHEDLERRKEISASSDNTELRATKRHALAGLSAMLVFLFLVVGIITQGWGTIHMAGFFLLLGLIPGLVAGLTLDEIAAGLAQGFSDILVGAMVCGIARGISVVLTDAKVIDTIIYELAKIVTILPSQLSAVGMIIVTTLFNGIITSGSGKAVIAMPIMFPLADFAGVTRQTAVLAYQIGDGITNVFWPTSGYFMAALAIGKVPYTKYVKFAWPLLLVWTLEGVVLVLIAHAIRWGPF